MRLTRAKLTVKIKLTLLVAIAGVLLVLVGLTGILALHKSNQSLNTSYTQVLAPTKTVSTIIEQVQNNRILLMQANNNAQPVIVNSIAKKIGDGQQIVDNLLDKYHRNNLSEEQNSLLARLTADRQAFVKALNLDLKFLQNGDATTAKMLGKMKVAPALAMIKDSAKKLSNLQVKNGAVLYQAAIEHYKQFRLITWGSIIFGCALMAIIGYFLGRTITRALTAAIDVTHSIAAGYLNNRVVIKSNDETGQLLHALAGMDKRLSNIVAQVRESADHVGAASREISLGNDDLSQRTQEQASSLEETSSSMEEMTATVRHSADSANHARQLAEGSRDQAVRGGDVVSRAVEAMSEINTSSEKIADIIGVIDDIAFQTNLLALNAAVEAARAGEQGRGFAVVASEVRNLAQRSANSAKEIKDLINDSVQKVKAGSSLVDESGQVLSDIVASVKKVTDIIAEIAASSQQQSLGIDEVNNAVSQMDEVTQQNAALVEQAASASRSMEEQAENLNQHMLFFHLGDDDASANKDAHQGPQRGNTVTRRGASSGDGRAVLRPVGPIQSGDKQHDLRRVNGDQTAANTRPNTGDTKQRIVARSASEPLVVSDEGDAWDEF